MWRNSWTFFGGIGFHGSKSHDALSSEEVNLVQYSLHRIKVGCLGASFTAFY